MKLFIFAISLLTPLISLAQEAATVAPAVAGAEAPAAPGVESLIFQLVIIFVIFYFLLIRPQQRKMKAHVAMTAALKKGDRVILASGFKGKVVKAVEGDKFVDVEIAENVIVTVLRSAVTENEDKIIPVKAAKSETANDNKKTKKLK
jgi:preprotein translocase subunit YajC